MKMTVGVIDRLKGAIDHINRHGTGHSEAIVTESDEAAGRFTADVDAAVVYVNASTRFTDGYVSGWEPRSAIRPQSCAPRGPIGLRELTTTKYIVHGDGQVRG